MTFPIILGIGTLAYLIWTFLTIAERVKHIEKLLTKDKEKQ